MKIKSSVIGKEISKLRSVVASKGTHEALEGILVSDGYLTANNMEMGVKIKFEAAQGKSFILPPKVLDLIPKLDQEEIELVLESDKLVVQGEGFKSIHCKLDTNAYPAITQIEAASFMIDGSVLVDALTRVLYATEIDPERPATGGVCFELKNHELNIVTACGSGMAWMKLQIALVDDDFETKFVVPAKAAHKLISLIGNSSDDVEIKSNGNQVSFCNGWLEGGFELVSKLIDAKFPDYEKYVVPSGNVIEVSNSTLVAAIERASLFTDNAIILKFAPEKITITSNNPMSEYSESIKADVYCENLAIAFNHKRLLSALKAFYGATIKLDVTTPIKPVIIQLNSQVALALPVKLNKYD